MKNSSHISFFPQIERLTPMQLLDGNYSGGREPQIGVPDHTEIIFLLATFLWQDKEK